MPLELVVAVVDAFEQRPLVLDRIDASRAHSARRARRARPGRCAARAAAACAQRGLVECSDSASAGFTRPSGSRSNTRRSPTVEKTRFLCPMPPVGAEQLDRLEHVVEVVRRLAHAHEHDLPHRRRRARERDLRDDLGAAELAQQAARGPSCRTRSRPRSRPGSRRTGRRAAAARSRPSGRRRARPAGARSRPRPRAPSARVASAASSSASAGKRGASCAGRNPRAGRGRRRAAATASTRAARACSWQGLAPGAQTLAKVVDQQRGWDANTRLAWRAMAPHPLRLLLQCALAFSPLLRQWRSKQRSSRPSSGSPTWTVPTMGITP